MSDKKWQRVDRLAKKLKAINYLGGNCELCNESNFFKLCFHHKSDEKKEGDINKLKFGRWSNIENEIKKCNLLCHNCHHELHSKKTNRPTINKNTILKYKNIFGCEICKYQICTASLDLHHKDPTTRDFALSNFSITYYDIEDLTEKIENELDKCVVLCKNCHYELHFNEDNFYYDNYDEILKKSENLKEVQPKINREEVKKMYKSGMRQVDIAKHFNARKSTISEIVKELGIKK